MHVYRQQFLSIFWINFIVQVLILLLFFKVKLWSLVLINLIFYDMADFMESFNINIELFLHNSITVMMLTLEHHKSC